MTKFGILQSSGDLEHEMDIDLEKVASPDPLAYAYGYFKAKSGQKILDRGERRRDLAPEYIRGYRDGKQDKPLISPAVGGNQHG